MNECETKPRGDFESVWTWLQWIFDQTSIACRKSYFFHCYCDCHRGVTVIHTFSLFLYYSGDFIGFLCYVCFLQHPSNTIENFYVVILLPAPPPHTHTNNKTPLVFCLSVARHVAHKTYRLINICLLIYDMHFPLQFAITSSNVLGKNMISSILSSNFILWNFGKWMLSMNGKQNPEGILNLFEHMYNEYLIIQVYHGIFFFIVIVIVVVVSLSSSFTIFSFNPSFF